MNDARRALLQGAINRQFAEALTVLPKKPAKADARPVADPTRPVTPFMGIFTAAPLSANPRSPGRSGHYAPEVTAGETSVQYSTDQLPFVVGRGDVIRRESTQELLVVLTAVPDGFGWIVLRLAES